MSEFMGQTTELASHKGHQENWDGNGPLHGGMKLTANEAATSWVQSDLRWMTQSDWQLKKSITSSAEARNCLKEDKFDTCKLLEGMNGPWQTSWKDGSEPALVLWACLLLKIKSFLLNSLACVTGMRRLPQIGLVLHQSFVLL